MIYNVWFAECDDCKVHLESPTRAQLLQELQEQAWTTYRGRRILHTCAECSPPRTEEVES